MDQPARLTATHQGHITLVPHGTVVNELYFNVMPFALIKKVTTRSTDIKCVTAFEENTVGILLAT